LLSGSAVEHVLRTNIPPARSRAGPLGARLGPSRAAQRGLQVDTTRHSGDALLPACEVIFGEWR
jgi:hypothetical protein